MFAEIITIGDEILIGQIIDTNSAYIASELNKVGIQVLQITSVQDEKHHILEAFANAKNRADVVLITGGLGPTKDDITKHTFCEFFEDVLVLNEDALQNVNKLFEKHLKRIFDFKNTLSVDVQTIFHKMEKRTLEAAYKFYCDEDLSNAHSAEADTNATYEVLKAQIERYEELENNTKFLATFSAHKKFADFAGYIGFDKNGEEVFAFGKHRGSKVEEILEKEPGYFGWLLNADFPLYTKKILTGIKLRKLNNKLN
jgi:molybdenum cofactor synthesis domain-containing protein